MDPTHTPVDHGMKLPEARILIVDDEPALRDIFQQWLLQAGCHHVAVAADGEEALAALLTSPFDLLVSDVRMPRMDGVTLVRRRWQMGGAIPTVIFVSGFGDIVEREMYSLGVEALLSKPLRRNEFLATVVNSLADRTELWRTPLQPPPHQIITLTDKNPAAGTDELSVVGRLCIGRGGLAAPYSGPSALGKVRFECSLSSEPFEIKGEGYVRWRSREENFLGIEFAWLEPGCHDAVVKLIETTNPRSFIPDPARIASETPRG